MNMSDTSKTTTTSSSRWSLHGRNFVVTGGTKGIGKAVVRSLLNNHASGVLFCSLSPCDLDDYIASLELELELERERQYERQYERCLGRTRKHLPVRTRCHLHRWRLRARTLHLAASCDRYR
mmetsp:Transcript_18519/g.42576  ORF Transcript_18519/g.42576 Transcript_18519/m.42576 type:complete len:122 (-) Transcript_18519:823-1188(-)